MKLIALALFISCAAHAQSPEAAAWRCGTEVRTYSDQPCANGRVVVAADARGANQVAQAHAVVAREKALARQLIAERHEREREAAMRGSGLIGIKPLASTAKAPAKEVEKKTPKKQRLEAARTSVSTAPASRQRRG